MSVFRFTSTHEMKSNAPFFGSPAELTKKFYLGSKRISAKAVDSFDEKDMTRQNYSI